MKKSGLSDYPGLGEKKSSGPGVVIAIGAGKTEKVDPTVKACREFFEAVGLEPKDEEAACDALVALVDIRIAESEEGEADADSERAEDDEVELG